MISPLPSASHDAIRESDPCSQIVSLLESGVPAESIFVYIECEYGVDMICRATSIRAGEPQTILDGLLSRLGSHRDFDTLDDRFHDLADLVLMMIHRRAAYAHGEDVLHTFKCLTTDVNRIRYMTILQQRRALNERVGEMVNIMLVDRNLGDPFDPKFIAESYHRLVDIDTPCCNEVPLRQHLLSGDLNFLQQLPETRPLYKRIIALAAAAHQVSQAKLTRAQANN